MHVAQTAREALTHVAYVYLKTIWCMMRSELIERILCDRSLNKYCVREHVWYCTPEHVVLLPESYHSPVPTDFYFWAASAASSP